MLSIKSRKRNWLMPKRCGVRKNRKISKNLKKTELRKRVKENHKFNKKELRKNHRNKSKKATSRLHTRKAPKNRTVFAKLKQSSNLLKTRVSSKASPKVPKQPSMESNRALSQGPNSFQVWEKVHSSRKMSQEFFHQREKSTLRHRDCSKF
jgi:hypothetical protein